MNKSQSRWRLATFVLDIGSLIIAYFFAYYLRFHSGIAFFRGESLGRFAPLVDYAKQLIILIPLYFMIYSVLRLIILNTNQKLLSEMAFVILANVLGIALYIMYLFLFRELDVSRWFLLIFLIVNILLDAIIRIIICRVQRIATVQG